MIEMILGIVFIMSVPGNDEDQIMLSYKMAVLNSDSAVTALQLTPKQLDRLAIILPTAPPEKPLARPDPKVLNDKIVSELSDTQNDRLFELALQWGMMHGEREPLPPTLQKFLGLSTAQKNGLKSVLADWADPSVRVVLIGRTLNRVQRRQLDELLGDIHTWPKMEGNVELFSMERADVNWVDLRLEIVWELVRKRKERE